MSGVRPPGLLTTEPCQLGGNETRYANRRELPISYPRDELSAEDPVLVVFREPVRHQLTAPDRARTALALSFSAIAISAVM